MVKTKLNETVEEYGTPNEKYYAFDWDDNIVTMPTQIILKDEDGDEIGMSTEDFAEFRDIIGKEPFEFDGHTIVGFSEDPLQIF